MNSRRSNGTSVALPPAARIWSSTSSRPPTVRAASTTCAPSPARRRAIAAPMPREAPVISAILPASRPPGVAIPVSFRRPRADRSGVFGQQRELHRDLAVVGVGGRDRVVAGKAGLEEGRGERGAASLAHRAVEAVDRQEGKAVDADKVGHL